jgi:Helix-turn-helix domain
MRPQEWLTDREVAAYLGRSVTTVQRWCREGGKWHGLTRKVSDGRGPERHRIPPGLLDVGNPSRTWGFALRELGQQRSRLERESGTTEALTAIDASMDVLRRLVAGRP